ncbi:MAG: hypothetical protein Q7S86_01435 [bacterium]|nr:hypothetical protein [bacterium]
MSILDYLEQLRKKPLYYRKRVAVLIASAITVVILIIWYSTLSFDTVKDVANSKTMAEELKPIQQIKASVVDFYSTVKEMSSGFFNTSTSSPSGR